MDLTPILAEAAERLKCHPHDLEWMAWSEMFPDTSGPLRRPAGQSVTRFQVFAFDNGMGDRIKCCAGVWKPWDGQPFGRW